MGTYGSIEEAKKSMAITKSVDTSQEHANNCGFACRQLRPVLTEINFGNFVLVFFLRVGPQKQFNSREYARIV